MNSTDSPAAVASPGIQEVPVTVDAKGRVRVSKEQRRVILAEFERSGMSAVQFAKLTGLKYSTLAGWRQRYRRTQRRGRARQVRLLEAVVEQDCGDKSSLVLALPGGATVQINDLKQVELAAALLRALGQPC